MLRCACRYVTYITRCSFDVVEGTTIDDDYYS